MFDIHREKNIAEFYVKKIQSSSQRKISFELTLEEFSQLVRQPTCFYSGKPFNMDKDHLKPTIERVNPSLGYTKDNCVMITKTANAQKSGLDAFVKSKEISDEIKIKLLRKAVYQLQKKIKSENLTNELVEALKSAL